VQPQLPVEPVQTPSVDAEAIAVAQRRQDASLYQQQQASSQKQQEELNQEIEEETKKQEDVQAEPRIQEIPSYDQSMQPQF
jgi:hypothetical protein